MIKFKLISYINNYKIKKAIRKIEIEIAIESDVDKLQNLLEKKRQYEQQLSTNAIK